MEFTNLLNTLEEFSKEFVALYKNKLQRDNKKATGELINSIKGEIVDGGTVFTFQIELADYWKWIENGTKPHWPPVDAIKKWIVAKPIIPREVSGIKPTNDQLAYLIGRKIAKDGTKAGLQLAETIEELNDILVKRVEDALTKDIEKYLEEIMIE